MSIPFKPTIKATLILLFNFFVLTASSQDVKVITSNEIQLPNRQRFIRTIHADETGCYVLESRYTHINFTFKANMVQTLYKMDQNCNLILQKTFADEFKGRVHEKVIFKDGYFYMFSGMYYQANKKYFYDIEMSKVSAKDFSVTTAILKIASMEPIDDKKVRNNFAFEINLIPNSTDFFLAIKRETPNDQKIKTIRFDKDFNELNSTTISYGNDPKLTSLINVKCNGKTIDVVTNNYDFTQEKKEKNKIRYLKSMSFTSYSFDGSKLKETIVDSKNNTPLSHCYLESDNNLIYTLSFYTKNLQEGLIDGISINKIDLNKNTITNTDSIPLNLQLLGYVNADDKKAKNGLIDFAFKSIIPDKETGDFIVLCEQLDLENYSSDGVYNLDLSKDFIGYNGKSSTSYYAGDLLMFSVGKNGKMNWLKAISKDQRESVVAMGSRSVVGPNKAFDVFEMTDYPFYSSFSTVSNNKSIHLIFNDHKKNVDVIGINKNAKIMDSFNDAEVNILSIDKKNGNLIRKKITMPQDEAVLMPKTAYVLNNILYIAAIKTRNLGKSDFRVSKIIIP